MSLGNHGNRPVRGPFHGMSLVLSVGSLTTQQTPESKCDSNHVEIEESVLEH